MADTVVDCLQRVMGVGLDVVCEISGTPCQARDSGLGELSLTLVTARSVSIWMQRIPLAFHQSAYSRRSSRPSMPYRAAPPQLRLATCGIVEPVDSLVHYCFVLDERHFDAQGAEVENVAYKVGVARVLDAELDRYADLLWQSRNTAPAYPRRMVSAERRR